MTKQSPLEGYAELLDKRDASELAFVVTAIGPSGAGEVMTAAKNLNIATAAFTASVVARPRARIVLRQGVRVLSDHPACEAVVATKED